MTFHTSFSPAPEPQHGYQASDLETPLGDAMAAQGELSVMGWIPSRMIFNSGVEEAQLGRRMGRFGGRYAPDSRALTLEEAQQQVKEAGVSGLVEVFDGMRERALRMQIDRSKEQQQLRETISRADQGFGTQLAIGATGIVVDFADPVNLATMAVPAAGATKVVYGLTKATAKLGPTASKLLVRAGSGVYEGAVSTATVEPLNYALRRSAGEDYSFTDSLANIATNAAGGGILNVAGGSALDVYRSMGAWTGRTAQESSDVMNVALGQIGQGEPVNLPAFDRDPVTHAVGDDATAPVPSAVVTPIGERTYAEALQPWFENHLATTIDTSLARLKALPDIELAEYSLSGGGETFEAYVGRDVHDSAAQWLDQFTDAVRVRKRLRGADGKLYELDAINAERKAMELKRKKKSMTQGKKQAKNYEQQFNDFIESVEVVTYQYTPQQVKDLEALKSRLRRLKNTPAPQPLGVGTAN